MQDRVDELSAKLSAREADADRLESALAAAKREAEAATRSLGEARQELTAVPLLRKECEMLNKALRDLKAELETERSVGVEKDKAIAALRREVEILHDTVSKLKSDLAGMRTAACCASCPLCAAPEGLRLRLCRGAGRSAPVVRVAKGGGVAS
jgi:chromosome segregation ATPase